MTTYNTGNPIGSTDARDLYDNAQALDQLVNGSAMSYSDRRGSTRRSLAGVEAAADLVLAGVGYAPPVNYAAGISLTLTTQTVEYNGSVYAPKISVLPFTTTGTFETAKFRLVQVSENVKTIRDFGGVGNGSTSDQTAVANAIASGFESIRVDDNYKFLVSSLSNTRGVEFEGYGHIVKAISGGLQKLNSYADKHKYVFGAEYLSAFHKLLMDPTRAPIGLFSGDSTTAGDGTSAGYRMHELMEEYARAKGLNTPYGLNFINAGHSGANTEMWRQYWLAGDLAQNPDLYVLRWGINDPGYYSTDFTTGPALDAGQSAPGRRTVDDFLTSLRAGLATIRASRSVASLSIVLMSPNSTADTPNGRDELWYEQIIPGIKQAARDFQCCFVDTYGFLRDSRPAAGVWMDDPMPGGGRAIHPYNVMNTWIAGLVGSVVFPEGLAAKVGRNGITAIGGAEDVGDVTRAPSYYKYGVTLSRANGAGFPFDGVLQTIRWNDEVVIQYCYPYVASQTSRYAFRIGRAVLLGAQPAGWDAWVYVGGSLSSVTASSGFTNPSTGGLRVAKSGSVATIEGYASKSAGIIAANTEVGVIASGFHPQRESLVGYYASGWDGTNWEPLFIRITPGGQIQVLKASTLNVVRVYVNATWNTDNLSS